MTAKTKTLPTGKTNYFKVDPRNIEVEPGFNIRVDYGDIEGLAASIRESGVKVALRGHRKKDAKGKAIDDKFVVTDGHRRLKACMLLVEQGEELLVPFMLEEQHYSEEDRILDMWRCNDGKPLNVMEKAELVYRLKNRGLEVSTIGDKVGVSGTYVSNLLLLCAAPVKLKKLVAEDKIAGSLAIKLLKTSPTADAAMLAVEQAMKNNVNGSGGMEGGGASKNNAGGSKKIREKDIRAATNQVDSKKELKQFLHEVEEGKHEIKPGMEATVSLLQSYMKNEIGMKAFISHFTK